MSLVQITEKLFKQATHKRVREGYRRYLDHLDTTRGAITLRSLYRDKKTRVYFYRVDCKCGNENVQINANAIIQAGQEYCSNQCRLKNKAAMKLRAKNNINGKVQPKHDYFKLKNAGKLPEGMDLKEYLRMHTVWSMILKRCGLRGTTPEKNYAGRRITVAKEWRKTSIPFILYMGPRPGPRYSVDRIDNDGNYAPGNVKWSTDKEQQRNSRKFLNASLRNYKLYFKYIGEYGTYISAIYIVKNSPILYKVRCGNCSSSRYIKQVRYSNIRNKVIACRCTNKVGNVASTSLKESISSLGFKASEVKKITRSSIPC